MKEKKYFLIGIGILAILILSYFIDIDVESGSNYNVKSSLLGALIFYNPFILGLYILISTVFILKSFKKLF